MDTYTVSAQQILRAEIGRELAQKVEAIRKVEGISFKRAWEKAKKKHAELFVSAARVEDGVVEAEREVRQRTERIFTAEAPMLARYGLTPDLVPEPYRSDPWYH